ncbi:MAG: MBOAT family protein [Lachnospiraceae bacterium]|nr:MBOAT family protein [Lachnospiraceae bacterium]
MSFNSIPFLCFFPIVILLYYILPGKARRLWLLAASYFFYMSWNAKYVLLILFTTVVTYAGAILLERAKEKRGKRIALSCIIVLNLLLLLFFKYFDFMLQNLNFALRLLHVQAVSSPFSLLLPVGISFYTFQSLGYAIDVYRGDIPAEKNFFDYALFVSFFPQLVAGPIERSGNLLKQLKDCSRKRLWSWDSVVSGFGLMLWGFFMKMCIADRLSIFVDAVFNNVYACGTVETVLGAAAFSLQIYADFAGYSSIAIGAARMMGFSLMENFNAPYFAESIGEFWHRWHISLSTWFRDYVYIPLGGNRKGKPRQYVNLMITFLVSGLWHGASWSFVFWGALHGFYQIAGNILKPVRAKLTKVLNLHEDSFSFHFGRKVITFVLTAFAWIFFRAHSMKLALEYIRRMFVKFNPWVLFDQSMFNWGPDRRETGILFFCLLLLLAVSLLREYKKTDLGEFLLKQDLWFRWLVFILLMLAVLVWGEYGLAFDSSQFIYFAF